MAQKIHSFAAALALAGGGPSVSASPEFTESTLYALNTGGYYGYRIPALLTTGAGTLLAFCEGRKLSLSDKGDIDILLRSSTDQGLTWSPQRVVIEEGGTAFIAFGNPAPVLDETTGHIHLLCCRNNNRIFHLISSDDGLTWSAPREITASVKLEPWGWYATGPGHGIQLKRGIHAGRLVIPCDHRIGVDGADEGPPGAHVIYSDDHGVTWQLGATANDDRVYANETTCVELVDPGNAGASKLYFNTRDQIGPAPGNRGEALSLDSGASFAPPGFTGNPFFTCPIVQGSSLRLRAIDEGAAANLILFSCPNSFTRKRISVWSSSDEATSWSAPKTIYEGPSAYSDLARTSDGRIAMLYESGITSPNERITFARYNEAWLSAGANTVSAESPGAAFWTFEETLPGGTVSTAPGAVRDVHPQNLGLHLTALQNLPAVVGSPTSGSGTALRFEAGEGLRISDLTSGNRLDFGPAHSFTVEALCRTAAGSPQTGSLVAKDLAPLSPSWWLRVEAGRVRFLVSDSAVECIVTSSAAINDGQWHHVAAVRDASNPSAKQLRIYVDGQLSGSTADTTTGSLANGQDLRIGRYNNGSRHFSGDIDYVRITPLPLQPAAFAGKWSQWDADGDLIPDAFERVETGALKLFGAGDTDGDGRPDLLEYATGTRLATVDQPVHSVEIGGNFVRILSRGRNLPPWLHFQLSSSGDLSGWQDVTPTMLLSPRPDGLLDRVDRLEAPDGLPDRRFFRYRLEKSQ